MNRKTKDPLSGLRQFWATESPLKMIKNAFYFTSNALFVLKIFKFCLDFLAMYRKGLIEKIKFNFKFYDVTTLLTNNCNTYIFNISRCLILFLMFACNNFPFRAFVTMIYWTSADMLLNLVASLDSAVPSLDWIRRDTEYPSVFSPNAGKCGKNTDQNNSKYGHFLHSVSVSRSPLNCVSHIRFKCSFFWPWENQFMVHGFDSISITQFPTMICSVSAESSLNRTAHSI